MTLFRDLILSASGKAAIIIGGGLNAPMEFSRAREAFPDAVLISVNEHGLKLADCPYIVCLDEVNVRIREDLGLKEGKFVTYHNWADHRIIEYPRCSNSGQLASWVAWNLGAAPIVLCGFDLYTKGTYFHDPNAFSTGTRIPEHTHLKTWDRTKKMLPAEAPIRVFCEPLSKLFKIFDPGEKFEGYSLPERHWFLQQAKGKVVRITRPARIGPESFEVGQKVELSRIDAQHLISRHRAVPVSV